MLESINRLAILLVCHAAYSAQFLQVIGHILRGMVRKPCVHKGLEIVLRSNDIPSDRSRRHAFRPNMCHITVPKPIMCTTRRA